MFYLFFTFLYSFKTKKTKHLDYTDKSGPGTPSRYSKAYDRRNHEDNANFYNNKKEANIDQKPSTYEQQNRITTAMNSALSVSEEKYNQFKYVEEKMSDIKNSIDYNDSLMNEKGPDPKEINVVEWLANENKEEKKMNMELEREVENNVMSGIEKEDRIKNLREENFINDRIEDREKKNRSLQWARHEYNVE